MNNIVYYTSYTDSKGQCTRPVKDVLKAVTMAKEKRGTIEPYHSTCDVFIPSVGCLCGMPYPSEIPEELRFKEKSILA